MWAREVEFCDVVVFSFSDVEVIGLLGDIDLRAGGGIVVVGINGGGVGDDLDDRATWGLCVVIDDDGVAVVGKFNDGTWRVGGGRRR